MRHVLGRFAMILAGLVAASLAAGLLIMLAETWGMTVPLRIEPGEAHTALLVNALILSAVALYHAAVPGVLFGLVAEARGWRRFLPYPVAGAAIGIAALYGVLPDWVHVTQEGDPLIRNPQVALPAAGIVGGAAYWLVTGCKAGFRRMGD